MAYLATLNQLKSMTDEAAFVDAVSAKVGELIKAQTFETTQRYRTFMLTHQAEIHVRLQGLLAHLGRFTDAEGKVNPSDFGVIGGFRGEDRSDRKVDHLVLGIPGVFAVHIITLIDEPLKKKVIQGVYGCFLRHDFQSYKGMPTQRTLRVSTIEQSVGLLGWLEKLGNNEPILDIEEDPTNTIAYMQKVYDSLWGESPKPMGTPLPKA